MANHEIVRSAAREVKNLSGITLELGTRLGDGTIAICEEMVKNGKRRAHICLDPYGNIDYNSFDGQWCKSDYTNQMKSRGMKDIYEWAFGNDYNIIFFCLEDVEFFIRFFDGVPVYENNKRMVNEYSLVFLDGPHSSDAVLRELEFFCPRVQSGGVIVCDDTDYYDHFGRVHPYVLSNGFVEFERNSRQISYKKI